MLGRAIIFASMWLFASALSSPHGRKHGPIANIPPVPKPHWVPCYGSGFTCTNLLVPLDYKNESAGTTNIAYIKYEPSDSQGQDILYNPGGPGSSGVNFMIKDARTISDILRGKFNIISFDPRGVGQSGPLLACPPSTKNNYGSMRNHKSARRNNDKSKFESAKAEAEACSAFNRHTDAKYAGTVANAQDMANFLDVSGIGDLWYLGMSYGTALGQTFAAMFPDRVGRMVLDSNVDATEWYTGVNPHLASGADEALESFFSYCRLAGPVCGYFDNDLDTMQNRLRALLESLKKEPPRYHGVEVTDAYDKLLRLIYQSFYNPMDKFPEISQILTAVERGNIEPLLTDQEWTNTDFNAHNLIMAIDSSVNFPIKTPEQYLKAKQEYERQSQWFGAQAADENLLPMVGYDLAPPPSQQFSGFNPKGTITKYPILFVNQYYDAVTSIVNAFKVSNSFPGSMVLIQRSTGHTMVGTHSACTKSFVSQYFAEGRFPPPKMFCEPTHIPFQRSENWS
jgi:pimeloyl-ACP methyl ester carboxylesterase